MVKSKDQENWERAYDVAVWNDKIRTAQEHLREMIEYLGKLYGEAPKKEVSNENKG